MQQSINDKIRKELPIQKPSLKKIIIINNKKVIKQREHT